MVKDKVTHKDRSDKDMDKRRVWILFHFCMALHLARTTFYPGIEGKLQRPQKWIMLKINKTLTTILYTQKEKKIHIHMVTYK